jgi:carboxyl-terminal processing protease
VKRILLTATVGWLLAGAALASPATDLFAQARQYLETQYFGPSTTDLKALGDSYAAKLATACAPTVDACGFDKAEPVIAEMLASLQDPHSYYLSAQDVRAEQANRQGANTSPSPRIGLQHRGFSDRDGKLITQDRLITNVIPGSPAEKAGIRYGDRWIGVNGTLFSSYTTPETYQAAIGDFSARIRGGETVTMMLVRGTDRQRLDINLKGEIINLSQFPTLELRPDGIAVITLRDYLIQGVGQRLHDLLRDATTRGAKGVVFNMRGNGGGSAYEMLIAVGAFLENVESFRFTPRYNADRDTLEFGYSLNKAFTRSGGSSQTGASVTNPVLYRGPLVTLVDGGCASGCEYFAAYMQRNKRGPVIGEPTVGVGNTNTARFALANGGALGIPTLRALWPDGSSLPARITPDILTPDYELELLNTGRDALLEKAVMTLNAPATVVSTPAANAFLDTQRPLGHSFGFSSGL